MMLIQTYHTAILSRVQKVPTFDKFRSNFIPKSLNEIDKKIERRGLMALFGSMAAKQKAEAE